MKYPAQDSITRALIRRELKALLATVEAIDRAADADPLTGFVAVAVGQQVRRPALAQLLEMEEERLAAQDDMETVWGDIFSLQVDNAVTSQVDLSSRTSSKFW